jgi:hypothetical protein
MLSKYSAAICFVVFFGLVSAGNNCAYNYDPVLVWANNKQYDPNNLPFYSNYTLVKQNVPLTDADLTAQRLAAVNWLQVQFGLNASLGTYDPVNQVTVYPGIGVLAPIFFNDSYELISSSDNKFKVDKCFFLTTVEIVFTVNAAGTSFQYGGKFGQLANLIGQSRQAMPSDGISFGYYYIMREVGHFNRIEKRMTFKSIVPNRADLSWRSHQFMQLDDSEWGKGQSLLEIQFYPNPSNGKITSQIVNTWKFKEPYNIYSAFGITI